MKMPYLVKLNTRLERLATLLSRYRQAHIISAHVIDHHTIKGVAEMMHATHPRTSSPESSFESLPPPAAKMDL
jgi:hypothetical protein